MYNKNMNNCCKKCALCCKLIPAHNGNIIRDSLQPIENFYTPLDINTAININEDYVKKVQNLIPNVEFYTCKYLTNNQCSHPNMPESCKKFPNSAVAIINDNCEYFGEIFLNHENLKHKIRKLKEEIIHYEALILSEPKEKSNYQKIINSHQNYIKKYQLFGSSKW